MVVRIMTLGRIRFDWSRRSPLATVDDDVDVRKFANLLIEQGLATQDEAKVVAARFLLRRAANRLAHMITGVPVIVRRRVERPLVGPLELWDVQGQYEDYLDLVAMTTWDKTPEALRIVGADDVCCIGDKAIMAALNPRGP